MSMKYCPEKGAEALEMYRAGQDFAAIGKRFRIDAERARAWVGLGQSRRVRHARQDEAERAGWGPDTEVSALPLPPRAIAAATALKARTLGDLQSAWRRKAWRRRLRAQEGFGAKSEAAMAAFLAHLAEEEGLLPEEPASFKPFRKAT
jgi:hypothetical protein